MTLPPRNRRRPPRPWLAVPLAVLLCGPSALTPVPVAAQGPESTAPSAAVDLPPIKAANSTPGTGNDASPSIQYLQAEEHAADKIAFDPGGRVTVPYTPRAGDPWEVDGRAPRALPSGNATGAQMRTEALGSIWAAGPPADLAPPGLAAPVDAPSSDRDTTGYALPASAIAPPANPTTTEGAAVGASGLRREIFGFLPYWVIGDSSTTLDWRTLSTVAYFSVGCLSSGYLDKYNSNGSSTTGWGGWTSSKMTSIINAAHKNQTRVVLTISCFAWSSAGASRQAHLLASATARSNFAKAAAAAVRDRGADGINLDFEPIVSGYSDEFTLLVRSVRSELNKVAAGYQLTFDALGSIGNQPIVDATAPGGADAVLIMGYDYRTASSSTAGSISPLTGPHYDLTDTVKAYTAKISPSKVILGVPYYGRAWSTSSGALHASTLSPSKYGNSATPTFAQAMDQVSQHGRRYDSVEQAPWTAYRKTTCTTTYGCLTSWRELYYDDGASLRLRYDLVNRSSLRGAGIWALGYDGTRPELRTALAEKFLTDTTAPLAGVATLAQQQRDEGFRVAWAGWDDSAIAWSDLQVSVDGGAWAAWLTGTTLTAAIYPGADGHTYAFRIRAADAHGNVSPWKSLSLGNLAAPGSITVGGFANVLTDGLRMRASPSTGAAILATLSAGDALQVIAGPVRSEGYTWYEVSGPVRQWAPVDAMQIGDWIAASGNGVTNAGPRRPVYATLVNAGITGMALAAGGARVLTPNGDGIEDTLRIAWTNQIAFDSLSLRVFRLDGSVVGDVGLSATGAGAHAWNWAGRIDGSLVPAGSYVLQLQGTRAGAAYSAPSASPVSSSWIVRYGVIVGAAAPTSVRAFSPPPTPTKATTLTWRLTFGGPIGGMSASDIARSGTATGCVVGAPVGAGASWTVTVTKCSPGTVTLGVKVNAVFDAVRNWGPATQVNAATLRIDRSAPSSTAPRASLRYGLSLPSTATTVGLLANLTWSATDPGGAGVGSYDVRRSVDGGSFTALASNVVPASMFVTLTPGHSYRFEVRARDKAGNVGGWAAGPTMRAYLPQQTYTGIIWKGTWANATVSQASGTSVRYAAAAGASATYAFTGRAIAWVTTLGPDRGSAKVYLDGVLVATLNLQASAPTDRRIAFSRTWSASGTHTIRIVVVGTAGHPRIDVDAFELLR